MAASDPRRTFDRRRIDYPTAYLPARTPREFQKGEVIYRPGDASDGLYLVVTGSVQIWIPVRGKSEIVFGVRAHDAFFGEACLGGAARRTEGAAALQRTRTMSWTSAEVEALIMRDPRLGLSFVRTVLRNYNTLADLLRSNMTETVSIRVVRALLRLADSCGGRTADGLVRIPPVTHQSLARLVGTSREMITANLRALQAQGCIQYSRQAIDLRPELLSGLLTGPRPAM